MRRPVPVDEHRAAVAEAEVVAAHVEVAERARRRPARSRPPRGSRAAAARASRATRRPVERNGSGSSATICQRPKSSAKPSRTAGVPGGGAERASSSSAARTASTRRASQRDLPVRLAQVLEREQRPRPVVVPACEPRDERALRVTRTPRARGGATRRVRRRRGLDEDAAPVGERDAEAVGGRIAAGTRLVAHRAGAERALDRRVELVHLRSDAARATGMRLPYAAPRGCSSMVERQVSTLDTRVRFPPPALSARDTSLAAATREDLRCGAWLALLPMRGRRMSTRRSSFRRCRCSTCSRSGASGLRGGRSSASRSAMVLAGGCVLDAAAPPRAALPAARAPAAERDPRRVGAALRRARASHGAMAAALARHAVWRVAVHPAVALPRLARELLRLARSGGLRRRARPAGAG